MYPFAKTIGSIGKSKLISLMIACALLAALVIICFVTGITWMTAHFVNIEKGWLDSLVNWLTGIITGIGGWFMLPALTVLFASLFQEKVIKRVERVYYPDDRNRADLKFWPEVWQDVQFTALALSLNIVILPLYLFGIGFAASILLNSYLLGREFFETAAGYHLGKAEAKKLRSKHKLAVYIGGLVITLTTLVPVMNLFVPIVAIAWMVHVYHSINTVDI